MEKALVSDSVSLSDLNWLGNYFNCSITETGRTVSSPGSYRYTPYQSATQDYTFRSRSVYQIQIDTYDLEHLIRVLREHDQEDRIHRHFPSLREAYVEYRTQVALTVAGMDRF